MVESVPGGELAPLVDQHRGLGAAVVGELHSTVIIVQYMYMYMCTVQLSQFTGIFHSVKFISGVQ